jgi:radical SAM protein with 4Fe4S-binding SPASM domain
MNLAETPLQQLEVPLPGFVQIEPVGRSRLNCKMALISSEAFRRLLQRFPAVKQLHLQGMGDPLRHPRFFELVAYAAGRGLEVSTNTDLAALSPRRAEECIRSGLRRIDVSLDAGDPESYEILHLAPRSSRVLMSLRRLADARGRLGARFPEITVVALAMRRNLEQLPDLVRLAREAGADRLKVEHLRPDWGERLPVKYRPRRKFVDAETLFKEDPARVEKWFGAAACRADELGIRLRLPQPPGPLPSERLRCDWPWRGAYIDYSGEAMPCAMAAKPLAGLGNMLREDVVRIWNNDAYRKFRQQLASDDPPEVCKGCPVYQGIA